MTRVKELLDDFPEDDPIRLALLGRGGATSACVSRANVTNRTPSEAEAGSSSNPPAGDSVRQSDNGGNTSSPGEVSAEQQGDAAEETGKMTATGGRQQHEPLPCYFFDYMIGTSTGGWVYLSPLRTRYLSIVGISSR